MELATVIVADEASELLEMIGVEFNDGGSAEAVGLLTSGDEGLAKEAANGFAPKEP